MKYSDGLKKLGSGYPILGSRFLSKKSFVSFFAKKLARPELLYVNSKALQNELKKIGIKSPPKKLTAKHRRQILDFFAYAVPESHDAKNAYRESRLEFFADRYGGLGMNNNWGAARSGTRGHLQWKGIGRTPLLGPRAEEWHRSGGLSVREAIHESIWAGVSANEFFDGANEVLFVIATGTTTETNTNFYEPRALLITQDLIRWAHYLKNSHVTGKAKQIDQERVVESLRLLPSAISHTLGKDSIKPGLLEFARRVGRLYACAYVKGIFHGAPSPSNIEMGGRVKDFGTATAIDGFTRVKLLPDVEPNGDFDSIKRDILEEIRDGLKSGLPKRNRRLLPTKKELGRVFKEEVERTINHELALLTGIPPQFMPSENRLSSVLLRLARVGNKTTISIQNEVPQNTGKYDLAKILIKASQHLGDPKAALDKKLCRLIQDQTLRKSLAHNYVAFMLEAAGLALSEAIDSETFRKEVSQRCKARNKKRRALMRGKKLWQSYARALASSEVQSLIDSRTK